MPLGTVYVGEESPRAGAEPVYGYRLVRRLGSGGHGEVWEAEAPGNFRVALKFIRLADGLGPAEARALGILRGIRHPNLLVTFGAWEVPGYLVLGLELADRTLWDRFCECVEQGMPGIPRDELIEFLAETAKGIDYLNEERRELDGSIRAGVQHRDLKPQNILLAGGGVKVGDFGLARQLEHDLTSHTGHWTFAYAAPEFFQHQTAHQSDQYSLAATYCHLSGGRPPFNGPPAVIMAGHLLLPPDLEMLFAAERPVVARALSKSPRDRWPNCRAFVEALRLAGLGAVPLAANQVAARLNPLPDDPTEFPTKTFPDDEPSRSPALLDSPSDDDLLAIVPDDEQLDDQRAVVTDVPPRDDERTPDADPVGEISRFFPTEDLVGILNGSADRDPKRLGRRVAIGVAASILMVGGLGLWSSDLLSSKLSIRLPSPDLQVAPRPDLPTPPLVAQPPLTHVVQGLSEVRDHAAPEPVAPVDREVGRAKTLVEDRRTPVLASAPAIRADEGIPMPLLLPPDEAEPLGLRAPEEVAIHPGGAGRLVIHARRHGREGSIMLVLEGAPAGVVLEPNMIPAGQDSAEVTVKAGTETGLGTHAARLVARVGEASAKVGLKLVVGPTPPAPSPRLAVSLPPTLTIQAGRGARLPIGLSREDIDGPLWAHFEGLPEGVAAADVPILAGSDHAEALIMAAAEAPHAEKTARLVVSGGSARGEASIAIRIEPSPALVSVRRGRALLDQRRYDDALEALDRALVLNPDEAAAYTLRGSILTRKGDYDRAITDFGEAIRRNADDAAAYNNRGLARRGRGEYHRAIADYNEAIRLNPADAVVRYNRGMAYHHLGDELMAIADFTRTIELDPNHAPAYRARSECYAKLGDRARAEEDREKARHLDSGRGKPGRILTIPGSGRTGKSPTPKRVVSDGTAGIEPTAHRPG